MTHPLIFFMMFPFGTVELGFEDFGGAYCALELFHYLYASKTESYA